MTRLDQALVERGLCESREKAKRAVMAGQVTINGQPPRKPSDPVKPEDHLTLAAAGEVCQPRRPQARTRPAAFPTRRHRTDRD